MLGLAVGLWPTPGSEFDPGKAVGFLTPMAFWLYAELFADEGGMDAHDQELATRIHAIMGEDDVRFLKEHDFGGTWLKRDLDPAYKLADLTRSVNAEFNDSKLQARFQRLAETVRRFANMMSLNASPFGLGPSPDTLPFSMIPDSERASEEWSERTINRVKEANDLGTELASEISEFYRLLRRKGANLLGKEGSLDV